MHKFAVVTALALWLPTEASAQMAGDFSTSLSPYAAVRTGHKPRNARVAHCTVKADGLKLEGKARSHYMRKCVKG